MTVGLHRRVVKHFSNELGDFVALQGNAYDLSGENGEVRNPILVYFDGDGGDTESWCKSRLERRTISSTNRPRGKGKVL